MPALKNPGAGGKRRRNTDKVERRFVVKKDSTKTRNLPTPATSPRKTRKAHNVFRTMVTAAMFCIVMSTALAWRRRVIKQKLRGSARYGTLYQQEHSAITNEASHQNHTGDDVEQSGPKTDIGGTEANSDVVKSDTLPGTSSEHFEKTEDAHKDHAQHETKNHSQEEPLSYEELPERIEWYSRSDFKDGSRPMCRISKPYILSNGTILVPDWMQKYERLLHRCGLGTHGFYSTETGPVGLEKTRDIAADFALTIHLEKFQEPTHDPSVYLTEHILKSSYLFDVFSGDAKPEEGVKEHHCYTTPNDSSCTMPRPVRTLLKPAIFVPKRIELSPPTSWSRQLVDMFGEAHGHGTGVIHLNASTTLLKSDEGKAENLIGTCFRSIMTTDGMFRHLPPKALQTSNFYSEKNGITRSSKKRNAEAPCDIQVGIASYEDPLHGIQGSEELKEKIEALGKLALSGYSVQVKQIQFSPAANLKTHISEMQDLDIYLGGSGNEMSSIGYLRGSASVLELMPFGIKPNAHASLARALNIQYDSMMGKPQIDDFKTCIDGEIYNLRKKGSVKFTESPDWQEPVMKAWNDAVSEYVLSASTTLDVLTASPPVNNYHARVCAQRQRIEIPTDDIARKVILLAKEMCTV